MGGTFTTIRYEQPFATEGPGTVAYYGGPEPFFRDNLDASRAMYRNVPEAQYPDGYLGTIRSRRDDRLLDSLKNRQNQRSYQRGVHKGERIDQSDYFWPQGMEPWSGLERQMTTGERHAPMLNAVPALVNDGKTHLPRGAEGIVELNTHRASQLVHLRPTWR